MLRAVAAMQTAQVARKAACTARFWLSLLPCALALSSAVSVVGDTLVSMPSVPMPSGASCGSPCNVAGMLVPIRGAFSCLFHFLRTAWQAWGPQLRITVPRANVPTYVANIVRSQETVRSSTSSSTAPAMLSVPLVPFGSKASSMAATRQTSKVTYVPHAPA